MGSQTRKSYKPPPPVTRSGLPGPLDILIRGTRLAKFSSPMIKYASGPVRSCSAQALFRIVFEHFTLLPLFVSSPRLTWRDVQHLIVWTSEYTPVKDNKGWHMNAVGLWFNTRFGFGLMNAFGLVSVASNWTSVPDKYICTIPSREM